MPEYVATKRVSSGKYVDLNALTESDIDVKDIDKALNHIYRFTGHYKDKEPLTVAQHTRLVLELCDRIFPNELDVKLDCIIHDWAEAYTGDIATPLKRLFGKQFNDYEQKIEEAIYRKYWYHSTPFDEEIKHKRKVCDLLSLDIERRSMWNSQLGKAHWPSIPMESILPLKEKSALFDKVQSDRWYSIEDTYNEAKQEYDFTKINKVQVYEVGE